MKELIPIERIESRIYLIRGQKVMIDRDLAELYGVETRVLKQAVKRNNDRFPADFMFELSRDELKKWRSQFVMSNSAKMGLRRRPYAFTEQGVAMLSGILNSPRAVEVNIMIMRAFVKLRKVLAANKDLSYLFKELKQKVNQHDAEIGLIIRTIEKMISSEPKSKRKIGFSNE